MELVGRRRLVARFVPILTPEFATSFVCQAILAKKVVRKVKTVPFFTQIFVESQPIKALVSRGIVLSFILDLQGRKTEKVLQRKQEKLNLNPLNLLRRTPTHLPAQMIF